MAPAACPHGDGPLTSQDGTAPISPDDDDMAPEPTDSTAKYAEEDVLMMQGCAGGSTVGQQRPAGDHNPAADNVFIVDSGATVHATGNPALFSGLNTSPQPPGASKYIRVANGSLVLIIGHGTVSTGNVLLDDVLCAPGLAKNIASVSQLGKLGYNVEFTRTQCFIREAGTGELVGKGRLVGGLFELEFLHARRV